MSIANLYPERNVGRKDRVCTEQYIPIGHADLVSIQRKRFVQELSVNAGQNLSQVTSDIRVGAPALVRKSVLAPSMLCKPAGVKLPGIGGDSR